MGTEIVKSYCALCEFSCGVLIHVEDGKAVKIEGDPDDPVNGGSICAKGLASLEMLYHPDRLQHPLKRAGERGEGKWQQITWDEALTTIADELIKARDDYGAESVAIIRSGANGLSDDIHSRFANVFGTPNFASPSPVCDMPSMAASTFTYGFMAVQDHENARCIVVWGANPTENRVAEKLPMMKGLATGAKLMLVDPWQREFGKKADLWLQPRPATDLALALGMINVIINENLYDKDFVEKWTVGFDELKAHVQDYPPEKVAEITWVPAEKIKEAARLYATNKPGCLLNGNGIEQNVNGFGTARALAILRAITGNVGARGGDVLVSANMTVAKGSPELSQKDMITPEVHELMIGADFMLPIATFVSREGMIRAIMEEDPYPIRAAYIRGSNLLLGLPNAQETYQALNKLDFFAVADFFMTPTAALADVVLPAATFFEYDAVAALGGGPLWVFQPRVQRKVAQIGESWSDYKIIIELAKKMGMGEYFWDNEEEFFDFALKPTGMTFQEFKQKERPRLAMLYEHYKENGFKTPSGKVELHSEQLKKWGFDPIPVYREPPETPFSDPELTKEYPLIMTSCKSGTFTHSTGKQLASLRAVRPDPTISIHPETASSLEIKDGDWVYIETKRGKIKQRAALTTCIDPRIVYVDYDWWFPEKGIAELYGWSQSNINILTNNRPPCNREMSTPNLRGLLCKVYKT